MSPPEPMPRGVGLAPAAQVRAADMLQRSVPSPPVAPVELPGGQPGRATPESVGIQDGPSVKFVVIGDSGGVQEATYQTDVAGAMVQALLKDPEIAFCYHVGDEVYFNGDESEYDNQFYEPYAHFNRPIVGIPGNHDGWPDAAVQDPAQTGIQTFLANFCDKEPDHPLSDPQFEYGRHTQTQPYCDWTLGHEAVTIVGVWTNVPSGGHLFDSQVAWLTAELKQAPTDRPLILAGHHPAYSVDAHHGGSAKLGALYDQCFEAAGRCPDLVLAGHVHDYQRFKRTFWNRDIPYIVIGNSGYHHLHALAGDAAPGAVPGTGVSFEYGDAGHWGFLVLEVAGAKISGSYVQVARGGTVSTGADSF